MLQPVVALGTALVLVASYGVIFLSARKHLTRFGELRFAANAERYRIAQEATGGIKDVKLLGLEDRYVRRFQIPARRLARVASARAVIATAPRYLLQGVAFGGMLLIILGMLLLQSASLGTHPAARSRSTPSPACGSCRRCSMVYQEVTAHALQPAGARSPCTRTSPRSAARHGHGGRGRPDAGARCASGSSSSTCTSATRSPSARRCGASSLSIPARTTVGIVGGTGAGKTTAVDLILGLLDRAGGPLEVDGVPITARNLRAWQNNIGYVPQAIFLTDDTVAANIAFGIPPEQIDQAAVERAARIAELHDFVTEELPQGYDTLVGERGVRLSGGQRQRIGIARALYHDPDVLIMDEATSALDNLTEKAVMDAVHNLGHAKTIVLIAHRLTTVQACDTIFMLEHGRLIAQGTYDELLETSRKFRAMAVGHAAAEGRPAVNDPIPTVLGAIRFPYGFHTRSRSSESA